MSLQLPQNYTPTTKNESVEAVVRAIEEEHLIRKEALDRKDYTGWLNSAQRGYYYAGFGCALSVLSTTNLDSTIVSSLNSQALRMIKFQLAMRAKILGIKPVDSMGDPVEAIKIKNIGKRVDSADLAGWESVEARQILVMMILNQLESDIEAIKGLKKIVNSGKKMARADLADLATQIMLDDYLLGFLDGVKFARGEEDFKIIDKKIKSASGEELDVLDYIAIAEREFRDINPSELITRSLNSAGKTVAKPVEVKPVKVIAKPPVVESTVISRYLKSCLG